MSGQGNPKTRHQKIEPLDLSVCILADEHRLNLNRCVNSVKDIASQIVIIDPRPRDGICQVFSDRGVKIVTTRATANRSRMRNAGLKVCSSRWILVLDCDEWLDATGCELIKRTLLSNKSHGFVLWTRHITRFDAEGEVIFRRNCRLFRNDPQIRFQRAAAESVEPSIDSIGGTISGTNFSAIHNDGHAQWAAAGLSEFERAASALNKELQGSPGCPELYYLLGLEYYCDGKLELAQNALVQACDLIDPAAPLASPIHSLLIVLYRELGVPEIGIALGGRLEEGQPTAELMFAMGWACMGASRFSDAEQYFKQSEVAARVRQDRCGCDPSIVKYKALIGRALALLETRNILESVKCARQAAKRAPEIAEPWVLLACCHQDQGENLKALKAINKAHLVDPAHEGAAELAIQLYSQNHQFAEAVNVAERFSKLRPESLHMRLGIAEILAEQGNLTEAKKAVDAAIDEGEKSASLLFRAAQVYLRCSDYVSTFRTCKQAIDIDPTNSRVYLCAADALFKMEAYTQASRMYTYAIDRDPLNENAYFAAGHAWLKCGRLEMAAQSWEKAVEIRPDFEEAQHNLRIAKHLLSRAA